MVRDLPRLRDVISEYGRLCRLEGHTPQSRGQRFNGLIAEALVSWGINATANVQSAGEIDVVFSVEGVHYILEAKWEQEKTDTGKIAKLQKRVRQRLAGTYGVFLSMSGYSPNALTDLKDGERLEILLLDGSHWEAMLGGLVPPDELFGLARDQAAFHGRAYAPLPEMFSSAARLPQLSFDAPATLPNGGLQSGLRGVQAEVI
jgi:Holliday junction resolvase-like predicted endonuclease